MDPHTWHRAVSAGAVLALAATLWEELRPFPKRRPKSESPILECSVARKVGNGSVR